MGGAEQSADEQHELALRKHARALLNGGSPVDERLGAAFHLHASVCAHAKLTDAVAHVERLFAICAAEASASREVRASHAGEAEAGIGSGAALAVRSACELLGDGGELIALPAQLLRVFALSPVGLAAVAASEAAALLCAALRVPSAGLRHCALPLLAQLAEQRTTAHALARAGAVRSLKAVCAQEGCDALDWHHALRIVDGLSATAAGLRAITSARAHTWLEAAAARCDGGRGQHLRLSAADGALLRRLSAELAAVAQMVGRPTLQRAAVPTSALGGGAGAMAPRTAWGGAEDGRIIRLPLRPSQQAGAQQADSGALPGGQPGRRAAAGPVSSAGNGFG